MRKDLADTIKEFSPTVAKKWWGYIGIWGSVSAVIAGLIGFAFWAKSAKPPMPIWTILTIVVGGIIFIGSVILAFHRLRIDRDKLKQDIENLKKPQEQRPVLSMEVGVVTVEPNGLVIVGITLRPTKKIQLASIALDHDGKDVPGEIQEGIKLPHFIDTTVVYKVQFSFFQNGMYAGAWQIEDQMRLALRKERHQVKLSLTADGAIWDSFIVIPTEVTKPEFLLKYEVKNVGELTVEREPNGYYKLMLPITLSLFNRSGTREMWLDRWAQAHLDTFLSDGTLEPYYLQNEEGGRFKLEPLEHKDIDYVLVRKGIFVEPVLRDTERAQWSGIGNINVQGYGQSPLDLPEPLENIKVHKLTQQPTSRTEDSQT